MVEVPWRVLEVDWARWVWSVLDLYGWFDGARWGWCNGCGPEKPRLRMEDAGGWKLGGN